MDGATDGDVDDPRMQLIGIYRLPSPMIFMEECAGTKVKTYIGDYDATIWLPDFLGPNNQFGSGSVRAPSAAGVPDEVLAQMLSERALDSLLIPTWGTVIANPEHGQAKLMISDVVIEYETLWLSNFEIDRVDGERRLITNFFVSTEFFGKIDPWFVRAMAWVSVLTGQPVDPYGRIKGAETEGEGLVVAARDTVGYTTPTQVGWSMPTYDRDVPALSLVDWQQAAELAEQSTLPEAPNVLVVEATAALALGDHRLAVIQAATAVEVALTERVDADIAALDSPIATAFAGERRTLGALVARAGALYSLPASAKDLVALRNKAVHRNYRPTDAEATNAIRIAKDILAALGPSSHD